MLNYTINKGTLAENMGGNVSTARVLALRPLKTPGIYRTWQEEAEELQRRKLVEGAGDKYNYSVIK